MKRKNKKKNQKKLIKRISLTKEMVTLAQLIGQLIITILTIIALIKK